MACKPSQVLLVFISDNYLATTCEVSQDSSRDHQPKAKTWPILCKGAGEESKLVTFPLLNSSAWSTLSDVRLLNRLLGGNVYGLRGHFLHWKKVTGALLFYSYTHSNALQIENKNHWNGLVFPERNVLEFQDRLPSSSHKSIGILSIKGLICKPNTIDQVNLISLHDCIVNI